MRKIEKHLILLTLAILFTLTISGAVSAQTYSTTTNFISITPSSTGADNDVTLYARLVRRGTSDGIEGQTINFLDQNGNLLASGTTDHWGYVSCTYHVPAGTSPRTIRIHAYYPGRSDPPGQGDGYGSSTSGTLDLTITATNHAPVANDGSKTINEDTSATGQISASDADGDTLTYTKTTDPVHGTVTVNPNTGAYTYTPNPNWSGTDSFTVTVSDGKGGSDIATVTITVSAVNDAPTVTGDSQTTPEDTPVSGGVTGSDADHDSLTYSVGTGIDGPQHGTVNLNSATGAYTYTPASNWFGTDSFKVLVSDGKGGFATATVTITVTPVNDNPVANNDAATINEDGSVFINVRGNDIDVDGDTLTITGVTQADHGTASLINGNVFYKPDSNWFGTASFMYTISDGHNGFATATVTITVTPVNDAPTVGNYDVTTPEDTDATGKVIGSDVDSSLTYSLGTPASQGTVVVNPDGSWTYTPNPNWSGTDTFTVTVSDGLATAISTVTITVTAVNDVPTVTGDSQTTPEDTPVSGGVTGTDADTGDSLTYTLGTGDDAPQHGTVNLNTATGAYTYTPEVNWHGTDSFKVIVSDDHGGFATATVTITVNSVNDAPVANDDSKTIDEDHTATGAVTGSDIEGDSLTYSKESDPAHGTVTVNADGSYIYTPFANYHGSDSFTVTVSDGHGGFATATVSITVSAVNDAPTVGNHDVATPEDTPVSGSVTGNDVDGDSLTYAKGSDPVHGTVSVNPDGTWTYTPFANYHGSDSFTVTVSDGHGGFATATVFITVNSVNDAPVANDDSKTIDEDHTAAGQVTATDIDGDSLTYTLGTDPVHGTVTVNPDGTYIYTPNGNWFGTDSFKVIISDGHGGFAIATVTITVNSVNDAPIATGDSKTTPEDTSISGQVTGSDIDGDSLTYSKDTDPAHGTVIVNSDGSYSYTPNSNWFGTDSFKVLVSDGKGGFDIATVTITVNSVNDAPVANDGSKTIDEDTSTTGQITGSDVDGDSLSYALGTGPAHGSVTVNADGTWTYTPFANYNGTDSFTVLVSDGHGGLATATVTITVTPVNDADVFVKTYISKTKLLIGENTVVTVKVGNNGPDSAQNVVVTYKIPEGMTFVGLTYEAGYPAPVYDPATHTITWNLGNLGIIDPWMKVVLYADETGASTNMANVISDTFDPVESNNLASIIVDVQNTVPEQPSVPEANAASKTRTIPLQHTGLPLAGFVLAALAIAGGLIPKRKN